MNVTACHGGNYYDVLIWLFSNILLRVCEIKMIKLNANSGLAELRLGFIQTT